MSNNVRPNKLQGKAYERWWPMYLECLDGNVGNMQEWIDGVENRWLNALRSEEV